MGVREVVWRRTPFADVLLDLRADRSVLLGRAKLYKTGTTWGGDLVVEVFLGPDSGGPWSFCGLLLTRGDRTVGFVVDAPERAGSAPGVVAEFVPGLWRRLEQGGPVLANPHGLGTASERASQDWWERKALKASDALAEGLFVALSDREAWFAGAPPEWSEREGVLALLRWAPIAGSAGDAAEWAAAGVGSPMDVIAWQWAGWADRGAIREWFSSGLEPGVAAEYREAGLSPVQAGLWWRNARSVAPAIAGVLAGSGRWSASGAREVLRAIETVEAGPGEANVALARWAALDGFTAAEVALCVRAGVSAEEAQRLREDGLWDASLLRFQAALRA